MKPASLQKFVKTAGLYNLALSLGLFVPSMSRMMGLNVTDQALAAVIGILLVYTAVIQYFASFDVKKYAWIIFWEGLLRWSAALILVYYGLLGHLGFMAAALGVVDFAIGCVYIFVIPKALSISRSQLIQPYR